MFGFQKLASLVTDLSQTVKAGDLIVVDELFAVLDTVCHPVKKTVQLSVKVRLTSS